MNKKQKSDEGVPFWRNHVSQWRGSGLKQAASCDPLTLHFANGVRLSGIAEHNMSVVKPYQDSLTRFILLIVFFSLLALVIGTKSGFLGVLIAEGIC